MQGFYEDYIEETDNVNDNIESIMDDEEILKRSKELIDIISNSNHELMELQSLCKHKDYTIKQISTNGISSLKKVCDICSKAIGYPSNKELNKWKNS